MYAYMRSNRYHPGGSHQFARDLARTVQLDEEIREADVWLVISDNGGGYSFGFAVLAFSLWTIVATDSEGIAVVQSFPRWRQSVQRGH